MQYTIAPSENMSFKHFLFKDKRNRKILNIVAISIVLQFLVFKYLYPFPSFIHGDSFSYLDAAYHNKSINTYLIGYSNFLRLVSVFTKSDTILVGIQYLFVQSSALFLLFSTFYFYNPTKGIIVILLTFFVCNPIFLHLANLVSSDCLFSTLSMTWFTLLIWLLHKPSKTVALWMAFVLGYAFTVRYNALIYPFISLAVLFLAKLSVKVKWLSGLTIFILCGSFIGFTSYKYKKLTNHWQYAPFSGWQWANNAMYAYRYVDSAKRKPVPKKFKALDNMIRQYFDSTRNTEKFPSEAAMASTFYMWSPSMPLMKYRDSLFKAQKDTTASEMKKWASMGPFYKRYGIYIIKQYPWHYFRYFIWPNANKYYAPPVEFLQTYNSQKDHVVPVAVSWFGYKNEKVKVRMGDNRVWVLDFYPILSGMMNVVMMCALICYFVLRGWRQIAFSKLVFLGGTFWLLNAAFTIFASSAALRFQSFPLLLTFSMAILIISWMIQMMKEVQAEEKEHFATQQRYEIPLSTKMFER